MKQKSRKYFGFTLIELMTVTVILGFLLPSIIAIYSFIIKSNKTLAVRQSAIQQGYEFFEKLNILMQDYTIDYEEYYNRQMVGCVGTSKRGSGFQWNIGTGGYCTEFTAYGNENSTNRIIGSSTFLTGAYHDIYYCSSSSSQNGQADIHKTVSSSNCGTTGTKQSFGQYAALFIDVKNPFQEYDNVELGHTLKSNISAIVDPNNIQELYLISNDGKNRLFFRRKLVPQSNTGDFAQYRIQILRLRGFDAGQQHNFDVVSEGSYDRQIDTWACDTSMGFEGHGKSVSGAYSEYKLPKDVDDCWTDLTYGSTNIFTWILSIFPQNDPDLYRSDQLHQLNPYIKIFIENGTYLPEFFNEKSAGSSIMNFKVPLQTTLNIKSFYRE